jgi:hypothetical protein
LATVGRRVEQLEADMGGRGPRCPECGGSPDDHGPEETYEVVFVPPEEAGENEWCPTCDGQTAFVIEW